jgi:hypothetical protein
VANPNARRIASRPSSVVPFVHFAYVRSNTGGVSGAPRPAVGLDAILDTHQINAAACSKERRQMNKLIDLLVKLRGG